MPHPFVDFTWNDPIIFLLRLVIRSGVVSCNRSTSFHEMLWEFFSPIHGTYPAYFILLHFVIVIIYVLSAEYKMRSSSLCNIHLFTCTGKFKKKYTLSKIYFTKTADAKSVLCTDGKEISKF
jgi:hypothetical protein